MASMQSSPASAVELEKGEGEAVQDLGDRALRLLRAATRVGASDIHLRPDAPPFIRLEGELRPLQYPNLTHEFVQAALEALAYGAGIPPEKLQQSQLDFSCVLS